MPERIAATTVVIDAGKCERGAKTARGIKDLLEQPKASFAIEIDVELSDETIKKVNRQINEMRRPRANDADPARALLGCGAADL